MCDILLIDKDLLFFSNIKPFNVIGVSQNQEIFAVVLKTDMVDPNLHVR
jgi:hypothetical protein